jgi:hypothetical protein
LFAAAKSHNDTCSSATTCFIAKQTNYCGMLSV